MYYSPYPKTKLFIDMVPVNAWGQNLRNKLFVMNAEWDRLRHETYHRANQRCEICWGKGKDHPVECHEQWHFDEKARVQTLRGLVALCPTCHAATHFGFSTARSPMGDALLRRHLGGVNGWTQAQVEQHIQEAKAQCQRLSKVTWSLNLTVLEREYADLLTPRTQCLLEALHEGRGFESYRIPMDVPQPSRIGEKLPPRVPKQRLSLPWSQDWVAGKDCEEMLVALLGAIAPSKDMDALLARDWGEGLPMRELRQLALDWLLPPLMQAHAGDADGFFDALEGSPLVPLAQRSARTGQWVLAFGLKAERHWRVNPSEWALVPATKALRWPNMAQIVGFDATKHEARMRAWLERFMAIYWEQVERLHELAIYDSAYVKP